MTVTKKKQTARRPVPAKEAARPAPAPIPFSGHKALWLCAAIVGALYIVSLFNGFTNWDDNGYLTSNALVKSFSLESLRKIAVTPVMGNYHPLTMLTYMLEYRLAGLNPFVYHLTNLVLHVLNTCLVFRLAMMLSGRMEVAFLTALLFGVHPMHVESVAWISERKDVLYAFFFLASLVYYVRYAKEGLRPKYLLISLLLFIPSLLSKGQAVSLAVLLFAIDYWLRRPFSMRLMLEKVPFFLLALVFGIVAVYIQHSFGYMQAINLYSFSDRIFFAFHAVVLYLGKLVLPLGLSCFYPFPLQKTALIYMSPVIVAGLLFLVYRSMRTTRLIAFGAAFFLVTIFLVLQLLPVGGAIISDRYTYIPYIGLFFIVATLLTGWMDRKPASQKTILTFAFAVVFIYSALAFNRIQVWKDSVTLWTAAIRTDSKVAVSYNNRANAYKELERKEEAIADYSRAIELNPNYYDALIGRGEMLRERGQYDQAFADLNKAIQMKPDAEWTAYMSRAVVYCVRGELQKAKEDFDKAFAGEKGSPELYCNMGNYEDMTGNHAKAIEYYTKAMEINPDYPNSYLSRASSRARRGELKEALVDYDAAVRVKPDYAEAYYNRAYVYHSLKDYRKALESAEKAVEYGFRMEAPFLEELRKLAKQ
jgi:protein O-mannosyl-transferase